VASSSLQAAKGVKGMSVCVWCEEIISDTDIPGFSQKDRSLAGFLPLLKHKVARPLPGFAGFRFFEAAGQSDS
jgi:hypothetical protein